MNNILESVQVSFLAMTVIFLVLSILIIVIKILVHFLPYSHKPEPQPKARTSEAPASSAHDEDHIAAIHAALAHHLGRAPQDIHIVQISSL